MAGGCMEPFLDGGPATSAMLYDAAGVAADCAGTVYIADTGDSIVRKVTPDGIITTVAGFGPYGYSGDGGPARAAQLSYPYGLALDSTGNLYIMDTGNDRVRKVALDGTISTVAGNGTDGFGGNGGPASGAQFHYPIGIALDAGGNLYIADSGNNRIRKIARDGTVSTVAGNGTAGYSGDNGPATSAELAAPRGVAVDAAGNLYIADSNNSRIRKVALDGTISTVAGNGVGAGIVPI